MKKLLLSTALIVVLFTVSCAYLTGGFDDVARDEFLTKLPMLNEQVLGELKYDDPHLDLRSLNIISYEELFRNIDLTDDDRDTLGFLDQGSVEKKLLVTQDSFLVCLRSEKKHYLLCDDAESAGADKIIVDLELPQLQDAFESFSKPFK